MSKSERVAPCHCCCCCGCSLCGCLTAFNLGHYNSRHFQWHLNAALCATRLDSTRILNSHRRRLQLPDWDNDKPNMILRQCYYVQRGEWGDRGEDLLLPNESLVCCSLLLCLFRRKWLSGWGLGSRISASPRVTGLDADVAAVIV